jgi:hypothetical protein
LCFVFYPILYAVEDFFKYKLHFVSYIGFILHD